MKECVLVEIICNFCSVMRTSWIFMIFYVIIPYLTPVDSENIFENVFQKSAYRSFVFCKYSLTDFKKADSKLLLRNS